MPRFGPHPKQFSQAGSEAGEPIVASASVSTDTAKDAPSYTPEPRKFYLSQGIFGNASNEAKVRGDTDFPDLVTEFETLDVVIGLDDDQTLEIAYQGRLNETETKVTSITIAVKGDQATATGPPQFNLTLYVEGGTNPIFDSGLIDAPDTLTEFEITEILISPQPAGQKRYFLIVEALVDFGQTLHCSRPFVRHS